MPSTLTLYNIAYLYLFDGTLPLDTTMYLALVDNGYTPDMELDEVWADVSAHEVATGDGYTTGGEEITTPVLTRDEASLKFDADDVTWTALTKTFMYGVIYAPGTFNGVTDPLLGLILFDDTPADVTVTGVDFLVQWNTAGIVTVEPA